MPIFAKNSMGLSKASQKGLTLIELLITLSILSLGALIAASAMNKALPQRVLDYAAEQLVSDLKRARLEAQKSGQAVAVYVEEESYEAPNLFERRLTNGVAAYLEAKSSGIVFHNSFANLGGEIVLTKGERRAVIAVAPITGKIERLE